MKTLFDGPRSGRRSDVSRVLTAFAGLSVGDLAADGDGIAGVAVLCDQDAVAGFLHGLFAGDLHRGVQVVLDGLGVVGGDFQDDVRVALDHRGLFLGGNLRDPGGHRLPGRAWPGAEAVVREGLPGIL